MNKCKTCVYRTKLTGFAFNTGSMIGCQYILIEGHSRGKTDGENCDKYIKGNPKKAKDTRWNT